MAGSGTMGDSGPTGTIPTAVAGTISRLPGQIALRQGGRALTYAQLGHAVAAAVAALIDLGVTSREIDTVAGTRVRTDITTAAPPVVVIAPIGLEGTVLQLAVLFSGRVCTPLEPTLGPDALLSIIGSTGGPVVCLDPDLLATLGAAGAPCADPSNLQLSVLLDAPAHDLHAPDGHPDDAALLCFTSGTTGTPKGVLVPHSMLIEAARFARTDETDVVAITSPPSFFASMLQTLLAIAVGGTGIYLDLTTNTPHSCIGSPSTTGSTTSPAPPHISESWPGHRSTNRSPRCGASTSVANPSRAPMSNCSAARSRRPGSATSTAVPRAAASPAWTWHRAMTSRRRGR